MLIRSISKYLLKDKNGDNKILPKPQHPAHHTHQYGNNILYTGVDIVDRVALLRHFHHYEYEEVLRRAKLKEYLLYCGGGGAVATFSLVTTPMYCQCMCCHHYRPGSGVQAGRMYDGARAGGVVWCARVVVRICCPSPPAPLLL